MNEPQKQDWKNCINGGNYKDCSGCSCFICVGSLPAGTNPLESQLQAAQARVEELEEAKGTETECIDLRKEAAQANKEKLELQKRVDQLEAENAALRNVNHEFGIMSITLGMLLMDYGDKSVSTVNERLVGAVKSVLQELEALRGVQRAAEEVMDGLNVIERNSFSLDIVELDLDDVKKLKDALAAVKGGETDENL